MAKDMVPINAVTKDGFKNLILTLGKNIAFLLVRSLLKPSKTCTIRAGRRLKLS